MRFKGNTLLPGIYLTLLAFLLPLKFGGMAAVTEYAGFFPPCWSDYLSITWPVHSFAIFASIGWLLTLWCKTENAPYSKLMFLWSVAVPLALLPGCFRSFDGGDADVALGIFAHFTALGIWVAAITRLFSADPRWKKILPAAFLTGVMIAVCHGYYQHFIGLEETRSYLREQLEAGVPISKALILKMADPRIFSFMASSNAFSGLLLTVILPVAYLLCRAGERFEPVKISRIVLPATGVIFIAGALCLTRARSAFVVAVVAAVLAFFSHPELHWRRKAAAAAAALLLLAGGVIFALHAGRGLASGVERLDYLRSSALMCAQKPLAGHGWGAFFFFHMREKQSSTDESARDPHNILAAFASQSGIPAAWIVLAALLWPPVRLWKKRFDGMTGTVFWSGIAFTLHLMMDCDMLIPAIMAGMLMLYASVLDEGKKEQNRAITAIVWSILLAFAALFSNVWFLQGEYALASFSDRIHPLSREQMISSRTKPVNELFRNVCYYRPFSALPYEMLGEFYADQHDYVEAESLFEKALILDPRRPGTYRQLATLAMLRGDRNRAETLMKQAGQLFPRNPKYRIPPEKLLEKDFFLDKR